MKTKQELIEERDLLQAQIDAMPDGCELQIDEAYYYVSSSGRTESWRWENDHIDKNMLAFDNVYPTEKLAEKASKLMRRSNAIIRACLLVDPDFEPDWVSMSQTKWTAYFDYTGSQWITLWDYDDQYSVAYVSSEEKAKQAIELLEKWGVE